MGLKILSLNAKGLNHLDKRASLWNTDLAHRCDILCIQHNVGSVREVTTLWNAHKVFARGVLLQMSSQAKKRRTQHFDQLLSSINRIEDLNKSQPH